MQRCRHLLLLSTCLLQPNVIVCLSVYNALTFESPDLESSFCHAGSSSESSGQVRISRSSGQGQGHRSNESVSVGLSYSRVICLLLNGTVLLRIFAAEVHLRRSGWRTIGDKSCGGG